MMEPEDISVFDESFEKLMKPRRIRILPVYLVVMSAIGLLYGVFIFFAMFDGFSNVLMPPGGDALSYHIGLYISLGFGILLVSAFFLMHVLVLLEWKWAIRFQWAGLAAATLIIGGICFINESMPFFFFVTIVFYIFYFFKIFPLKNKWEDAVSWRKQ